ncbi:MAG: response regulator [Candidatus Calescibacterium sp.]|nr:response regulator [Candidatus Calescibacterium sp.]MCX7971888.1 response regulator [bacterium]MDW8195013.1 response regulator [Candidatus Calescibacterium sp.]
MKKIMIVDDDPNIVELVTRILDLEGYQSIGTSNPKDALEILDKYWKDISIIICDYMMPEMDGLELVKKVRKNPLYNDIKIIMLTAIDTYDIIRQSMLMGIKDYIIKPFDPQEVINAIERIKEDEVKDR